jgi:hypothetical protein
MARNGAREDDLTVRQENVVTLLAAGYTVQKAAETARVPVRTVHRWLSESVAFQAELTRLRAERFQTVADALGTLQSKAVGKLDDLLDAPKEAIRLSAVRTTFEHAAALRQLTSFEARLAELERRAALGESE